MNLRLVWFTLVFAVPALAAAEPRLLTLHACVDLALGRSPDIKVLQLEVDAAEETVRATRAGLLPSLSAHLSAETLWGDPTTRFSLLQIADAEDSFGGGGRVFTDRTTVRDRQTFVTRTRTRGRITTTRSQTSNSSETTENKFQPANPPASATFPALGFGGVALSYPLFKDGSILGLNDAPAVQSAKAQRAALVWTKDLTREQIIFIVASAWLEASTRAERLRLDARRVELAEHRLANLGEQAALGLKLANDVQFAEAQLRSSRQMLTLARAHDAAARMHLAPLLDLPPQTLAVSTSLPPAPALPALEGLLAGALERHPGLGVQHALIDQKSSDYRLARAQMQPQVWFNTAYRHGVDLGTSKDQGLYTAAVSVAVPLFDFGAQRAATRAAQDRYLAEKIRLTKVGDDIRRAILDAYSALLVLQEGVASGERDVVQAETLFRLARSQWETGLAPPLAATDAELLLIEKSETLNDQRQKELTQFALLQNAAGGTWQWLR